MRSRFRLEAGGHRGSFRSRRIRLRERSRSSSDRRHRRCAVIAAGGIGDARGVIAALSLGTEAVQMGTVFLRAGVRRQPPSSQTLRGKSGHTALTKGFTGRLARASTTTDGRVKPAGNEILPYPCSEHSSKLAIPRRRRVDRISCPMGWQSANLSTCTNVSALLDSLVEEVL